MTPEAEALIGFLRNPLKYDTRLELVTIASERAEQAAALIEAQAGELKIQDDANEILTRKVNELEAMQEQTWIDSGIASLQAQLGQAKAKLAQAEKDAERYRWLRAQFTSFHDGQYPDYNFRCTVMLKPTEGSPTIDGIVDAALSAQRAEGE